MAVVFCCKFVRIYQRNLWSTTITLVKVFLWNSIYTKKCLVTCYYNSHRSNIPKHLNIVSKTLNFLPPKYGYILLDDECDAQWNEVPMVTFSSITTWRTLLSSQPDLKTQRNLNALILYWPISHNHCKIRLW